MSDAASIMRDRLRSRAPQQRAGSGSSWYSIANAAGEVAEVRIYDVIDSVWGISADRFVAELQEITAPEIVVAINSPGGSVFDGIAIYNALRLHSAKVTTRVDSLAASIASVIAQAGDHRQMVTGSQMMIHRAWGWAIGDADAVRSYAEILDRQDDNLAAIYAERAGSDAAHFAGLMAAETWMSADEALEQGLADEIITPSRQSDAGETDARTPIRFAEQAAQVVTEVEQLVARAQEVVTFRAAQGKEPLSEDSIESFARLRAAIDSLVELQADETDPTHDIEAEFLRFVAITQEITR